MRMWLASSYGAGEREVDAAFERGVEVFFWGALRRRSFGKALRRLAARHPVRVVIQTFTHAPALVPPSVELARRRLGVDVIDTLCLGYRNEPIAAPVLGAARRLVERGLVRHLMVSSHDNALLASMAASPAWSALMVRYNAAHRSAEAQVFPAALANARPIVAYTALRWGTLLEAASASDCYRFVLSHPAVSACLFGPADMKELLEALTSLDRGPMSEEELASMRRIGDAVHARRRAAPPLGPRDWARHARGMARSIARHGFTEDLLSRFNR